MRTVETLADLACSPEVVPLDLTGTSMKAAAKSCREYCAASGKMKPEAEAVRFYFLNHAVAEVSKRRHRKELLPASEQFFVAEYQRALNELVPRMFYYLLLITTREARHGSWSATKVEKFKTLVSSETANFFVDKEMGGDSETLVKSFDKKVPDVTLGDYTMGVWHAFKLASYSGGFGGKKWADIAHCLKQAAHGEISMERMVDEAFALSHNNGPIFNKGMLYSMYSSKILMILDAQRGGQIPSLVRSGHLESEWLASVMPYLAQAEQEFGGVFAESQPDWQAMKEAGAVGNYSMMKTKAAPKKPNPNLVGMYHVMPGLDVEIVKRKVAA